MFQKLVKFSRYFEKSSKTLSFQSVWANYKSIFFSNLPFNVSQAIIFDKKVL